MRACLALVLFLAVAAQAGTAEDPEVQDSADDATANGHPACAPEAGCLGATQFVDVLAAWVQNETSASFTFVLDGGDNGNVYGAVDHEVRFTVRGKAFMAGFRVEQSDPAGHADVAPTGVATEAFYDEARLLNIRVPRTAVGEPRANDTISGLHVTTHMAVGAITFEDRAPDAGFGRTYAFRLSGPSSSGQGGESSPPPRLPPPARDAETGSPPVPSGATGYASGAEPGALPMPLPFTHVAAALAACLAWRRHVAARMP